ncbi:hypothetical protein FAZ15_17480 [Sphingobacterium olei]|uniref:Uncharacterized protein n=1 Tax=Sphingobacterium olei TaxID=2571155 RepID=A0A4U0NI57_9SPHI|nr:hypothetical protein [Sphingobacterium olei]TJZ53810.1 hypothetical protein FAZ15_17480 [Sphingobacterium olei]
MNFELADKLYGLLQTKKLDEAIALAESELRNIPETDFHKILGRNLLHLVSDLKKYIADFEQSTSDILKKKHGFIKSIFGSKEKQRPVAFYCEMNGFTINYDRWFIDLFSFEKFSLDNWDWISDFYDSTSADFTITGFEDIQIVFRDMHENERFDEPNLDKAYEVCELLVILRIQELFRETYNSTKDEWSAIPMFVTAHDYDLIYKANIK